RGGRHSPTGGTKGRGAPAGGGGGGGSGGGDCWPGAAGARPAADGMSTPATPAYALLVAVGRDLAPDPPIGPARWPSIVLAAGSLGVVPTVREAAPRRYRIARWYRLAGWGIVGQSGAVGPEHQPAGGHGPCRPYGRATGKCPSGPPSSIAPPSSGTITGASPTARRRRSGTSSAGASRASTTCRSTSATT